MESKETGNEKEKVSIHSHRGTRGYEACACAQCSPAGHRRCAHQRGKGTAKSTAVRALADILPPFGSDGSEAMQVVELPVNATEDRVVGTIDLEHALKEGEKKFEPGLLAKAHNNILYVDEINLLDDHVVDVLLDAAAMGVNTVEREGISYSHPSRFVLVGTMNPEEGISVPSSWTASAFLLP